MRDTNYVFPLANPPQIIYMLSSVSAKPRHLGFMLQGNGFDTGPENGERS